MVKKSNNNENENFNINLNGKSFDKDSNLSNEQMNNMFGKLNYGLEKMMNKMGGNLHQVMQDANTNHLMDKNSADIANLKKIAKDRPVVETLKQDGKIKVNFDGETLLDLDLSNVESQDNDD
ncbi:hypothetical protein [Bacillus chungangensis]|uniref:Uncharacterized protein n=1 Tax=Bacillus chungangensis TaxID=587633 RepID=A0ABT9WS54_9BACI|nr:hypothetical protein [Bacillus chungangensis]MDQ0176128.1 hypothetical protein [Bacillus chungangensis]